MVTKPKGRFIYENIAINTIPRIISGIIIGKDAKLLIKSSKNNFFPRIASAALTPIISASTHAENASIILFKSAFFISPSLKSIFYQSSEKPSHTLESFDLLKEYTTVKIIGR